MNNAIDQLRDRIKAMDPSGTVPAADFIELAEWHLKLAGANIHAINYLHGGPLDITLNPPAWFLSDLVIRMAETLGNAMNYSSFTAEVPNVGQVEIVVQRTAGKTPAMQLAEAERHIANLLGKPSKEQRKAAQLFFNRPRTVKK